MSRPPHVRQRLKKVNTILGVIVAMALVGALAQYLLNQLYFDSLTSHIIGALLAFGVGMLLLLVYLDKRHILTIAEIGLQGNRSADHAALGFIVGLVLGAALMVLQWLGIIPLSTKPDNFYMLFLSSCIAAPLFEELLFRGFLFNYILRFFPAISPRRLTTTERRWVVVAAFVVATFIFTFAHMRTPIILVLLFANSLVMTYMYYKTASLLSPIIVHATYNFISLIT